MGRLIAISNRTAADPAARAGGLAVAVWDALKSTGGAWFGWSGDLIETPSRTLKVLDDEGVQFVLTDLTHDEYEGYYLQYANRVIWPVFHSRVDIAHFEHEAFEIYARVNERIAGLVSGRLREDDQVWVHDYHFLLMGDALRRAGWDGALGFFLHIPFPSTDTFRALPEHARIARALCAFDVVGVQSDGDRAHLAQYLVDDCGGEELGNGRISVFGKIVKVAAYPIGIDAQAIERAAVSETAETAARRIGRFLGERRLIVGVDRMDYSKGLPQRFEAVGKLLDTYTEYHGKVSFTQIAPPSRSKVEEYRELRETLDGLAGRINGDYGDLDWIPIRYLARSYAREELAGVFRLADVGLVTPLRDGMNLVAKEYVMAQDPEDPGVLILSEFAGAAEQLTSALLVNPHDAMGVAETVHQALSMSLAERKERWTVLRDVIVSKDINWWRGLFLADLEAARSEA